MRSNSKKRKLSIEDRSYKYAHIFLHSSTGFNLKLVELICDPNNGFNVDEQLFVTAFKPLYDIVRDRCHAAYFEGAGRYNNVHMINRYGDKAEWLIVHSFSGKMHHLIFNVNKKYLNKIMWRTWGHDVASVDCYIRYYNHNPIKRFLYSAGYYALTKTVCLLNREPWKNLYAVGIGNIIDTINIKECYGLTKTYWMPYPGKEEYKILQTASVERTNDELYHVMVGHSGYENDRHCKVLEILKPFENEQVMLHLVLSYGVEDYVQKVKEYVKNVWHGKIEIFEDTVEFEDYVKYMNRMDAVILDGLPSYALGNLSMILFLRKKLFLNRNGILKSGLIAERIPFHYTDEIPGMSFEQFSAREKYTVPEESTLMAQSYEKCVNAWKKIFEDLR